MREKTVSLKKGEWFAWGYTSYLIKCRVRIWTQVSWTSDSAPLSLFMSFYHAMHLNCPFLHPTPRLRHPNRVFSDASVQSVWSNPNHSLSQHVPDPRAHCVLDRAGVFPLTISYYSALLINSQKLQRLENPVSITTFLSVTKPFDLFSFYTNYWCRDARIIIVWENIQL